MSSILSNLYVLIVATIAWNYLSIFPKKYSEHFYVNNAFYLLWLFITTTMIEYQNNVLFWGIYIIFILLVLKINRYVHIAKPCWLYYLFIFWAICTLFYSKHLYSGIMMIVKLSMPLLFYNLTQKAIDNTQSVWFLFEKIVTCLYVYAMLGVISKLTGEYLSTFHYFGMPLSAITLALYWKTRKIKYIVLFFMSMIPPCIYLKRTPLLGIGCSTFLFLYCLYRIKAIIPVALIAILGIFIIFHIPGFKERIFSINVVSDIDFIELFNWDIFNYISSSGRYEMWNFVIEKFYIGNKIEGCGLGTLKGFLSSPLNENQATFTLLHNDWLHLLCETGLIGTILLAAFFIRFLLKTLKYSNPKYPKDIRLISACCSGVIISTNIHMYFENCVNSIIFFMPLIFYAMFVTVIKSYEKKYYTNE